jgi:capsular polysaccharide biosynthesis protein
MEIRRYLSIVRRRLVLIIAIVAAALAAAFFVTSRGHTYTARSMLYAGSRPLDIAPSSGQVSLERVAGLDRLIGTFTALARTRPIADAAIRRTGVARSSEYVMAATSATQIPNTYLIRVSFKDSDPAVSQAMANGVATALVNQIRSFEARRLAAPVLSVYDSARRPAVPDPSKLVHNLALAGMLGLIAAGLVVAFLEYLDITLRSPADAERELELPVLAVVPSSGDKPSVGAVGTAGAAGPTDPSTRPGGAQRG